MTRAGMCSRVGMKSRWQRAPSEQYAPCITLPALQQGSLCAYVNSGGGCRGGGILICQVGLIKTSVGRDGDGGGPALTCFRLEGERGGVTDDFPVLALPHIFKMAPAELPACAAVNPPLPRTMHRHLHVNFMCEWVSCGILKGDYSTACGGNVCSVVIACQLGN